MEQTKANRPVSYDYPCERGADMERTNKEIHRSRNGPAP